MNEAEESWRGKCTLYLRDHRQNVFRWNSFISCLPNRIFPIMDVSSEGGEGIRYRWKGSRNSDRNWDVLLQVAPSSRNPCAPNKLAKRTWHRHNEHPPSSLVTRMEPLSRRVAPSASNKRSRNEAKCWSIERGNGRGKTRSFESRMDR